MSLRRLGRATWRLIGLMVRLVALGILAWAAELSAARGGLWIALGGLLGLIVLVGLFVECLRAYAFHPNDAGYLGITRAIERILSLR